MGGHSRALRAGLDLCEPLALGEDRRVDRIFEGRQTCIMHIRAYSQLYSLCSVSLLGLSGVAGAFDTTGMETSYLALRFHC